MSRKQSMTDLDRGRRRALRRQILSGVEFLEHAEVAELLGSEEADLSRAASIRENGILRFRVAGTWRYPDFQFDRRGRRVHPSFVAIKAAAEGAGWSNYRLLNWLMRPHLDFDGVPADSLKSPDDDVLSAFLREIEPECHG